MCHYPHLEDKFLQISFPSIAQGGFVKGMVDLSDKYSYAAALGSIEYGLVINCTHFPVWYYIGA